jgi:hypothetical protein
MEATNEFFTEQEQPSTPFESDTQRIVRRHLEDPNHVITDEDLKSIRVGMTPPVMDKNSNLDSEPDSRNELAVD